MSNKLLHHSVTISVDDETLFKSIEAFKANEVDVDNKLIFITQSYLPDAINPNAYMDISAIYNVLDFAALDKLNYLVMGKNTDCFEIASFLRKLQNYQYALSQEQRFRYIIVLYNVDFHLINLASDQLAEVTNEAKLAKFNLIYAYEDASLFSKFDPEVIASIKVNTNAILSGLPLNAYID